jgi:hypothetical protein
MYMVMLLVIYILKKEYDISASGFGRNVAVIILSVLLIVQYADLRNFIHFKGERFDTRVTWESQLNASEWEELGEHFDHIVFLFEVPGIPMVFIMGDYALNFNMTVNGFYISRYDQDAVYNFRAEERDRVLSEIIDINTVYILGNELQPAYALVDGLSIYLIDDFFIGIRSNFTFRDSVMTPLRVSGNIIDIKPFTDIYISNADFLDDMVVIYYDGYLASLNLNLTYGIYQFTWAGDNFDYAQFDLLFGDEQESLEFEIISRTNNLVRFNVETEGWTTRVRTICNNQSDTNVIVSSITFQRIG